MNERTGEAPPKKILIFSPYGQWYVHSQLEAFLAMSLITRGADVRFFGCQGIAEVCNVNIGLNKQQACTNCWNAGQGFQSQFGITVESADQWLSTAEHSECAQWAERASQGDFVHELFEGVPVGNSAHAHLFCINRTGSPDFHSLALQDQAKGLLFGGAKLVRAFKNLCKTWRPDQAFVLQAATLPPQRVFFDTMRSLGIPTLIHERGPVDSSFTFRSNEHFCEHEKFLDETKKWFEAPLTIEELESTKLNILQRSKGANTNFYKMYRQQADLELFLSCLSLNPRLPLASILVSSGWEYRIDENRKIFETQFEGILKLSHLLVEEGYQVAIRYHPNIILQAHQDFRFLTFASDLANELPDQARVILPTEPASSYSLMWLSDAIFTFGSSSGLEACLRGCGTYSTVRNYLAITAGMPYPETEADVEHFVGSFPEIVQSLQQQTLHPKRETLRAAFRSYHFNFQRFYFLFKGIAIKDVYQPNITITNVEELAPGFDSVLDVVCDHLLNGRSLIPEIPLTRKDDPLLLSQETAWIDQEIKNIEEERSHHRSILQSYKKTEQPVSLIRLQVQDLHGARPAPRALVYKENITRLRYENFTLQNIFFSVSDSALSFLALLQDLVDRTPQAAFVGFFHDRSRTLEGRLNYSLHQFNKESHPDVVVHGCWIRDEQDIIHDEWATFRKPDHSWSLLVQKFQGDLPLLHLLACSIWKREALSKCCVTLRQHFDESATLLELGEKIFTILDSNPSTLWYGDDPLCEIRRFKVPESKRDFDSLKIL